MAYSQEQVVAVRRSFINEQLPLERAAEKHGIPVGTARRWKKDALAAGDNWENLKTAYVMAAGGLEETSRHVLMSFMVQFNAVMEELTTNPDIPAIMRADKITSLADAYNKMVASSRRVLPEINQLVTAMDVLKLLGDFVKKTRPDLAMAYVELLGTFGPEVQKVYGGKVG